MRSIDAFRGYAILLVIASHVTGHIPSMVWPLKRVVLLGVFGVQLFFIASALTLLMSWHRASGSFSSKCKVFFIHRFFRIAPLYFLAIVFYWFAYRQTPADFKLSTLMATLFFYNAWSPYLIPTVGGWTPVPGGWSISVEFCFYLIFPMLAVMVTNKTRALAFMAFSVVLLAMVPVVGFQLYPELTIEQRNNFLYFSFPNHLIIFAIGFLLHEMLRSQTVLTAVADSRISAVMASMALVAAYIGLAWTPVGQFLNPLTFIPPGHVLISIAFFLWAIVVILKPGRIVVNAAIVAIGKQSFSMYILHFALLYSTKYLLERAWPFSVNGIWSIPYTVVFMVVATAVTYLCAMLTNRCIELPCIRLGKKLGALVAPVRTGSGAQPFSRNSGVS